MPVDIIIRKQSFRIRTRSEEEALQVRRQLTEDWQYQLLHCVEKVAGQFHLSEDTHLYIDKIAVALSCATPPDIKGFSLQCIEQELYKAVSRQINAQQTKDTGTENSSAEGMDDEAALLFFLKNGYFPWWYKKRKTPQQLLADLYSSGKESSMLRLLASAKNTAPLAQRFAQHLPAELLGPVIEEVVQWCNSTAVKSHLATLPDKAGAKAVCAFFSLSESDYHRYLLFFLLQHSPEENFVRQFLRYLYKQKPLVQPSQASRLAATIGNVPLAEIMQERKEKTNAEQEKMFLQESTPLPGGEEGIYIANAGAILFHPFLPSLFRNAALLTEQNRFVSPAAQHRAAVLFQYLQTLDEAYREWEMPLTKILCGLPADDLLPGDVVLTQQEKEECHEVLKEMVNHWQALRGASPEAMLGTFVHRHGKIRFKDNYWLLQVERTAADILLDHLPWAIGVVRLPWLSNIIYTEW